MTVGIRDRGSLGSVRSHGRDTRDIAARWWLEVIQAVKLVELPSSEAINQGSLNWKNGTRDASTCLFAKELVVQYQVL